MKERGDAVEAVGYRQQPSPSPPVSAVRLYSASHQGPGRCTTPPRHPSVWYQRRAPAYHPVMTPTPFVPARSKLEAVARLYAAAQAPAEPLGPGSKEKKSVLIRTADRLSLPVDTTAPKNVLARQILQALHAAHRVGVVHRDIKPENILVPPEGPVRVADFGLARAASEASQSSTGNMLGTVAYIAPEIARGGGE